MKQSVFGVVASVALMSAATAAVSEFQETVSVIPRPQQVRMVPGQSFTLGADTTIICGEERVRQPATMLADALRGHGAGHRQRERR